MKILVQSENGDKRVITLVPPITELHDGERLCSFHCGDGTDHYFTPDGFYDGWGRCLPAGATEQQAHEEITRMQDNESPIGGS